LLGEVARLVARLVLFLGHLLEGFGRKRGDAVALGL
jgi:hypothetical protein